MLFLILEIKNFCSILSNHLFWTEALPIFFNLFFPCIYIHPNFLLKYSIYSINFFALCINQSVWWVSFIWFIFLKDILGHQLITFWFSCLPICWLVQLPCSSSVIWRDNRTSYSMQGDNNISFESGRLSVLWYYQNAQESSVSIPSTPASGTRIWPLLVLITGQQ